MFNIFVFWFISYFVRLYLHCLLANETMVTLWIANTIFCSKIFCMTEKENCYYFAIVTDIVGFIHNCHWQQQPGCQCQPHTYLCTGIYLWDCIRRPNINTEWKLYNEHQTTNETQSSFLLGIFPSSDSCRSPIV